MLPYKSVSFTQTTKEPKHFKERRVEKGAKKRAFEEAALMNQWIHQYQAKSAGRQERKDKVQLIQMLM